MLVCKPQVCNNYFAEVYYIAIFSKPFCLIIVKNRPCDYHLNYNCTQSSLFVADVLKCFPLFIETKILQEYYQSQTV